MKEKRLWYGYLDAGQKSTLVVLDHSLQTGNEQTVYLFNLARGKFLEYQRQIVEPKLRELNPEQTTATKQLKTAYTKARRNFKPHDNRVVQFPARGSSTKETAAQEPLEELTEFMGNDGEGFTENEDWFDKN
ncbi:hypothetical protein Nhal_1503 [Nitrosococcus halophilus Nc 4]|uniref:Uncharacterized protein n=1 Tax=Nitrosococcus halophilus (strain Nc4) TaxID=472759 RepID=D5C1L3_NITHN|nr:hypothetical protein [Nitrosococcus halophilus]ADE14646.1 hypothetical protein Nhal_1503 [Nitrosococcus halophilus Nc 4]